MLANLDNEVHFKKVFTDVEVFTAFVKDVLGIDIHIDKVETEKVLPSKVSAIKFKMDLFAEDKATRTVVEIQKVDYDYTYDRFSHYFLANLVDVQRKSEDYSFDQEVYVIVVVTSAYKISDITGKPIKKDVLITDINPRDLNGEIIRMTNHKMLILNPTYIQPNTPEGIADWLNLIKESMKNPENPNINTSKPAIVRAAKLAEKEKLTPEQVAEAKIQNMRKKAIAVGEKQAAEEAAEEARKETKKQITDKGIKKALKRGKLSIQEIAEDFEVTEEYVRQIENEMNKNK
jgi:DNA-binding transcriptional regulator YiaG